MVSLGRVCFQASAFDILDGGTCHTTLKVVAGSDYLLFPSLPKHLFSGIGLTTKKLMSEDV
jgi:hypothetical protein